MNILDNMSNTLNRGKVVNGRSVGRLLLCVWGGGGSVVMKYNYY